MKATIKKISFMTISILTGIIGLIFAFIELRPLFASDFLLYENPTFSFVSYLLRGLFFIIVIFNAVILSIHVFIGKKFSILGTLLTIAIILGAGLSFLFFQWYVALILVVLNLILLVIRLFAIK